jgi:hypothetical protein
MSSIVLGDDAVGDEPVDASAELESPEHLTPTIGCERTTDHEALSSMFHVSPNYPV